MSGCARAFCRKEERGEGTQGDSRQLQACFLSPAPSFPVEKELFHVLLVLASAYADLSPGLPRGEGRVAVRPLVQGSLKKQFVSKGKKILSFGGLALAR